MEYTFVLKDKGINNQGWWLKISSAEELVNYIIQTPQKYGKVAENFMFGKEFNPDSKVHSPNWEYEPLTRAIVESAEDGQTFIDALVSFSTDVVENQLKAIEKYGCIFINRRGAYHADTNGKQKYDFIRRKTLCFPDFKKDDIRIKQFDGGEHFYAYIDNVQVRDGDTLKWNSYEDAYEQALMYVRAK